MGHTDLVTLGLDGFLQSAPSSTLAWAGDHSHIALLSILLAERLLHMLLPGRAWTGTVRLAGLFRNSQQEGQLFHRRAGDDLEVLRAEFVLQQSMELLEDLLNVIPNRFKQDEFGIFIR